MLAKLNVNQNRFQIVIMQRKVELSTPLEWAIRQPVDWRGP